MGLLLIVAALLAGLTAPAAASAAAAVVVEPVPGTDVDQLGGVLAYPRPVAGGGLELVLRRADGAVERVAGPQEADFQQDLGTDANGRAVLVYRDCADGCSLRLRDVERGERALLPSSGRDRLPAIWAGVLAFSRAYPPRRAGGPPREYVYLRRLGARSRARVAWGPSGRPGSDVTSLDLGAGGLAFGRDWSEGDGNTTELWAKRPGRPARIVARTASGLLSHARHRGPSVVGNTLLWAHHRDLDVPAGLLLRRDLRTGRTLEARVPGLAWSVAGDALRPRAPVFLGSVTGEQTGSDAIHRLEPAPVFRPVRAGIGVR